MEISYRGLEHLDITVRRQMFQALALGHSPLDIALEFGAPLEPIVQWLKDQDSQLAPAARRQLALLRLDKISGKVLGLLDEAEDPATVAQMARSWAELNKREAAMAGLDAPTKQETDIRVQVAWLQPGRLSYREATELAPDILAAAGPAGPAPALPPPSEDKEKGP